MDNLPRDIEFTIYDFIERIQLLLPLRLVSKRICSIVDTVIDKRNPLKPLSSARADQRKHIEKRFPTCFASFDFIYLNDVTRLLKDTVDGHYWACKSFYSFLKQNTCIDGRRIDGSNENCVYFGLKFNGLPYCPSPSATIFPFVDKTNNYVDISLYYPSTGFAMVLLHSYSDSSCKKRHNALNRQKCCKLYTLTQTTVISYITSLSVPRAKLEISLQNGEETIKGNLRSYAGIKRKRNSRNLK